MSEDLTRALFISRAGADAALAAEVARILEADGYRTILQQWDFPNHSIMQQMHDALAGGARVVALLSAEYLRSDYCAAEWQSVLAGDPLNKQSRLIVLRATECNPTGLLTAISYWDLVPLLGTPLLGDVVRSAVREGRRKDATPVAGPYWRASRTISNPEAVGETPSFTGREAELEALDAALWQGSGVAALYGMGGTGKSALAREYARRNLTRYAVVWRIDAQTELGIIDGLVQLGARLVPGLAEAQDRRAAAVQVIVTALSGFEKSVLLVFDNLEDEALLRAWRPPGTQVLVTSRNSAWGGGVDAIRLSVWPLDDATTYLQTESRRGDIVLPEFRTLAETLDRLPLALAHAAAYLKRFRTVTVQRYIERIEFHLGNAPKGTRGERAVYATFQEAIAKAEQEAPGSAAVACFAAFFAPNAIPEELLRQSIDAYPDELQPSLPDDIQPARSLRSILEEQEVLEEALGELDRLSLLVFNLEGRTFTVHLLVQRAARALLVFDQPLWVASAIAVLDFAFPIVEFAAWEQCARLIPHVRAALSRLDDSVPHALASSLASRSGEYLLKRAAFIEAEPLLRRALAIDEANYGPKDPMVATCLNNLAELLRVTNRLRDAEPLYRRALAIDEEVFGPEHPNVALPLNNFAELLKETDRLSEAEQLYRRALKIVEDNWGIEHPIVATCLNNLADLLKKTNRLSEAEPLFRRALVIDEDSYGPEHPDVARDLNNLAELLRETSRLSEAEPLFRLALGIFEAAYGPSHPDVARSLNNLALLLSTANRLEDAEPLYRRALTILEACYGPEHPAVATCLSNIGWLLKDTSRLEEMQSLLRRVLAINEASYGPGHPEVARALNNLAWALHATNHSSEAELLYRRALRINEASFGLDHPMVAIFLNNLAELLGDDSRLNEAEPLLRRALAIDEASYGLEHPNVARDLNNLAYLLCATNRSGEAEALYRRSLKINEASYGPDHPAVATALKNLTGLLEDDNH